MAASVEDLQSGPTDRLDETMLQSVLAQRLQEGFTLEYKETVGNGARILDGVAAMANTFGGVMLVGIEEDRPDGQPAFGFPGKVVGVDPGERARVASMCRTQLVPPFDPAVHSIEVANGQMVLVIRVNDLVAPRPIMVRNRILVRTEEGNHPADLFRLRSLFSQSAPVSGASIFPSLSPTSHTAWSEVPVADLIVRTAIAARVAPSAGTLRITDRIRSRVVESLADAPLGEWLRKVLPSDGFNDWHAHGHSTSTDTEFRWLGCIDNGNFFPEAQCSIKLPNISTAGGRLVCTIDVILRMALLDELWNAAGVSSTGGGARLGLDDLYWLLVALMDTVALIAVLTPELAGVATGPVEGPYCYVQSRVRHLGEVVDLRALRVVPGNQVGHGADLRPDPELRLQDSSSRRVQATAWMRQLLLDCHLKGVDAVVDGLTG